VKTSFNKIASDFPILYLIGNTPLIELRRIHRGEAGKIFIKLDFMNQAKAIGIITIAHVSEEGNTITIKPIEVRELEMEVSSLALPYIAISAVITGVIIFKVLTIRRAGTNQISTQ
jgi:hypothetical protein